ncbi:MAG: SPOR domain-containing protein [Nitrospinae bacterium]|nr:SPOR domain-containing protein [Nitrospinota bacterium]
MVKKITSFFFIILTPFILNGCVGATIGATIVGLIPGSLSYIAENTPTSTESIDFNDLEEIVVMTLRELDFKVVDISETDIKDSSRSKEIVGVPSKSDGKNLKAKVSIAELTKKICKIEVTATDSTLDYDGSTAKAILNEILLNIEVENQYVDVDKFKLKTSKKDKLLQSLNEEKKKYSIKGSNENEKIDPKKEMQVVTKNELKKNKVIKEAGKVQDVQEEATAISKTVESTSLNQTVEAIKKMEVEKKPIPIGNEKEDIHSLKENINKIIVANKELKSGKVFNKPESMPYTIKLGSFGDLKNVDALMSEWEKKGQVPFFSSVKVKNHQIYRVFINRFPSKQSAQKSIDELKLARLLEKGAIPYKATFAIKVDECFTPDECDKKKTKLTASGVYTYPHNVMNAEGKTTFLLVGGFATVKETESAVNSLKKLGFSQQIIKP